MRLLNNMRITPKFFLTPGILLLLICAMAATALSALDQSAATLDQFGSKEFRRQLAASTLTHEVAEAQGGLYHLLALLSNSADNEAALRLGEQVSAHITDIGTLLQQVEDIGLPAGNRGDINTAGKELSAYSDAAHDVINMSLVDLATATLLMSKTELHFAKFYRFVTDLERYSRNDAEEALKNAALKAAKARMTYLSLLAVSLVSGITATFLLGRTIVRSVLDLTKAMTNLAEGDTARPIQETERLDEIGGMARALETFRCNAIAAAELADRAAKEENERRQNQKMEAIGRLAGGIAHEINTPIQYIADNLQFLRDAKHSYDRLLGEYDQMAQAADVAKVCGAERKAVAEIIKEIDFEYLQTECPRAVDQSLSGIEQIRSIVYAMKEFAAPPTAKKGPVNINHLLETAASVCRAEWRYVAELKYEFDPQAGTVQGLAGELSQAFLNIIVNAAYAIQARFAKSQSGTITIRTLRNGDRINIDFEDNGIGMTDEIREKIFDPFFSTKELGQGTGQGLTLVHDIIVRKHSGKITVISAPGQGTCVTVSIPVAEME